MQGLQGLRGVRGDAGVASVREESPQEGVPSKEREEKRRHEVVVQPLQQGVLVEKHGEVAIEAFSGPANPL